MVGTSISPGFFALPRLSPAMLIVPFTVLMSLATAPSLARDDDHKRRDEVRRASEAGEILSLSKILVRVRRAEKPEP